jgi:ribonucleoside-triphosphate reductase
MEALIHNLNTMHSRAGAQTPFSSINYGMDQSPEGRMVMKNLLLATEAGLGNGETPIFPIQIFRVKEGVNYNPEDPNYDLFRLAMRCSAKRLFPNFSFMDAPFNAKYYQEGNPETEIAYMGCRTRVIANAFDPSREISTGRGNLSFTTINLPRIALKAKGDIHVFFEDLDRKIDLCINQLLERFEIQARKKVRNFPFLMGQQVWLDSEKLGWDDEIREIIKHGTLSMGFIGLAETLKALIGEHHGESEKAKVLGLEIISHMRSRMDEESKKRKMNFTLLATPAEGLSGRFVRMDKERFGVIEGITDKEYYTNSFHVPVGYPISAYEKIEIEAPYHTLTNAGHISYVELDGDPTGNLEAFEKIIRCMKEKGIGYGSVNHPVDRDPVCGFTGIIGDQCPGCGRTEEDGVHFERIRRITGYLVGTLERFNDAKRAEEHDRVKHNV